MYLLRLSKQTPFMPHSEEYSQRVVITLEPGTCVFELIYFDTDTKRSNDRAFYDDKNDIA